MRWPSFTIGVLMLALMACSTENEVADTVLRGGFVWSGRGMPAATALALRGDTIVATGSDATINAWVGPGTEVIDLAGRWVLPGFVDAHTHFIDGGFQLAALDFRDVDTPEAFVARIAEAVAGLPPGVWIQGGNWDEQKWGGALPHRQWLDSVSPDHPVFVTRTDLHMGVANGLALERAGLTGATPDPPGGVIGRDPITGAATGILRDAAMNPVFGAIPEPSEAQFDDALQAAASHALSLGVTQVHDMGTWAHWETYRRAHARNALPLRVYSVVPIATVARLAETVAQEGRGDERLWWGGLKGFVDGSLGSTTAWFHDPYTDDPSTAGILTTDTTQLREWILDADERGLQVIVHAIGDRANDWLLDTYAEAEAAHGPRDRRFRIEHAQHLGPDAVTRFAPLGVIPSMQPYHAADDGRWAEARIGSDRARGTYAFRSLLDAGAAVAFGSDWTVAPLDPMLGLAAAVTRRTLDGAHPDGWIPEERIDMEEAVEAYTAGAARAGYSDGFTGMLTPGRRGDVVVLSGNPFAWTGDATDRPVVDLTMVDGQVVYRRNSP